MNELGIEPHHLGIDDLGATIRPVRLPTRIIGILMALEDEHGDSRSSDRMVALNSSGKSALKLNRQLAMDAETSLGFGKTNPLLYRSANDHPSLLSLDRKLVQNVNVRLEAAEDEMAGKLLSGHRYTLLELPNRVAERKVLDGDEVRALSSAGMTAASEDPKSLAP